MGGGKGGGGSAQAALQQALNNQTQVDNNLLGLANQQSQQYNQYYGTPLAGATSAYNANLSALSPGLASNYNLLGNGNTSNTTGVNQNLLGQNLVNYDSNTAGTNLAQANPAISNFYTNEMQNGINPQFASNAQSQISQNYNQQINDARAHAAPGQNINALTKDLRNQELTQSTNLAGNLAGQSQTFANQGAAGVAGTASNLDAQKQQMLAQALSSGLGLNTQTLNNLIKAIESQNGGLNDVTKFIGQGEAGIGQAESSLGNVSNTLNGQINTFATQAQQQQGSGGILGGILGTVGNLASGGLGGVIGNGISNLFGGGGGTSNGADMGNASFGDY